MKRQSDALLMTSRSWTSPGSFGSSEIVRKLNVAGIPAAEVRDSDAAVRDPGILGDTGEHDRQCQLPTLRPPQL